jgi:hypothetical protein
VPRPNPIASLYLDRRLIRAGSRRLAALHWLLALGVATLVSVTWRLWTPQQIFPQVPLLGIGHALPPWLDWPLLALLIAAPIVRSNPQTNARAMPGRTPCARASPMKLNPRSTTQVPMREVVTTARIPASNACIMNSFENGSVSQLTAQTPPGSPPRSNASGRDRSRHPTPHSQERLDEGERRPRRDPLVRSVARRVPGSRRSR